jgi:hypothetical protein
MRVIALLLLVAAADAQERATITGKVAENSGKPLEHTTVMVYEARVRKGYSAFCPTCWIDCGKRTATNAEGAFTISGLNPELVFTLLVIREGFSSAYVRNIDPAKGPAEITTLKPRPVIQDTSQVVRGLVIDGHGDPVKEAVIEQQGVTFKGPDGRIGTRFGGAMDWIDQIAVTNDKGEFEIAFSKPAVEMIVSVQPRAMASRLFTLPTGPDRHKLTVTEGAVVRGRLVLPDGKPVGNAEVGLTTHSRRSGTTLPEVRIGTREDGTFVITNVLPGRIFIAYPKMESLAGRNLAGGVVPLETKDDGQEIDIGDIVVRPAHTVRGKIVLSDGKPIPPDMRVSLGADMAWDSQIKPIAPDGSFEFRGVADGVYSLSPAVRSYRAGDGFGIEILVKGDFNNLVVRMDPDTRGQSRR